jgi:2-keto-3-deoxy-galactonokinase
MSIHPVIPEIQEELAVVGGTIKRLKRQLIVMQGTIEKWVAWCERIEKFIERREGEIAELVKKEISDEKK